MLLYVSFYFGSFLIDFRRTLSCFIGPSKLIGHRSSSNNHAAFRNSDLLEPTVTNVSIQELRPSHVNAEGFARVVEESA